MRMRGVQRGIKDKGLAVKNLREGAFLPEWRNRTTANLADTRLKETLINAGGEAGRANW